jgi:hypothetical protein
VRAFGGSVESDGMQGVGARRLGGWRLVALPALAAAAVVLWGGYDREWRWTGFAHRALLWDWLHVLVLPLAVTIVPLWLRHRDRIGRGRHMLLWSAVGAFVVLVALGYSLDWGWTGFPGNTLWDWLELLVLPFAVVLVPLWLELSAGIRARHALLGAALIGALAICAVGGYEYAWGWTGFRGNTLFDWLQLFLAPLLLPLVLVPLAAAWMGETAAPPSATREPGALREGAASAPPSAGAH